MQHIKSSWNKDMREKLSKNISRLYNLKHTTEFITDTHRIVYRNMEFIILFILTMCIATWNL